MNRNLGRMYKEGLDVNHDFALQRIYQAGIEDGLDMAVAASLPPIEPQPAAAPGGEASVENPPGPVVSVQVPGSEGQGDLNATIPNPPAEATAPAERPADFVDTVPADAGSAGGSEPGVVDAPLAASVEGSDAAGTAAVEAGVAADAGQSAPADSDPVA